MFHVDARHHAGARERATLGRYSPKVKGESTWNPSIFQTFPFRFLFFQCFSFFFLSFSRTSETAGFCSSSFQRVRLKWAVNLFLYLDLVSTSSTTTHLCTLYWGCERRTDIVTGELKRSRKDEDPKCVGSAGWQEAAKGTSHQTVPNLHAAWKLTIDNIRW